MRRLTTSLILRSCSLSGVRADVVIFTTSRRSANSFFSMASFKRSWLVYSKVIPLRASDEMRMRISSRKERLAFSVMPICSSIERINCSSGSISSSVMGSCHLVVLFTSFADEVQVALALLASDAGVLVKSIAQGAQCINGIDAGDILLDERVREAIDDIARRDTVHTFAYRFFLQFLDVLLLEVLDIFTIIEAKLFHQAHSSLLGWLQARQDGENAGNTQRVWGNMDV